MPKPFGWSSSVIPKAILDKFTLKEIEGVKPEPVESVVIRKDPENERTIVEKFMAASNKESLDKVKGVKQAPILR